MAQEFSLIHLFVLCFVLKVTALPAVSMGDTNARPALALDIEACTCLPITKNCDVTIAGSFFSEVNCPDNQHFCCSAAKKPPKTVIVTIANSTSTNDTSTSGTGTGARSSPSTESDSGHSGSSPRIKIVVPTAPANDLLPPSGSQAGENGHGSSIDKSKTHCRCKLREKCDKNHTDYSFGFHCTYDKVRCCEPIDMNSTIEQRNSEQDPDPDQEKEKEIVKFNSDGRIISLSSDMQNADEITRSKENCIGLPASQCQQANQQPVPIPLVIIPTDPNSRSRGEKMTSTLPPPQLPFQYHYPPSSSYYRYVPVTQRVPILPVKYYYSTTSPMTNKNGNMYLINNNGRGFYQSGRSTPSGLASFFTNLSRLVG